MTDSVATIVLGIISKNLEDIKDVKDKSLFEIIAFWAPLFLLHLGGLDTITTYSLEDNKFWLRHLLGLGVQTWVVLYIWIIALTGSLTLHSDVFYRNYQVQGEDMGTKVGK